MSVGCLIRVDSQNRVQARLPIWPFPDDRSTVQEVHMNGDKILFFPVPYYNFPLGETINVPSS